MMLASCSAPSVRFTASSSAYSSSLSASTSSARRSVLGKLVQVALEQRRVEGAVLLELHAGEDVLAAVAQAAQVLLEHVLGDRPDLAHHVAEDVAVHLVEGVEHRVERVLGHEVLVEGVDLLALDAQRGRWRAARRAPSASRCRRSRSRGRSRARCARRPPGAGRAPRRARGCRGRSSGHALEHQVALGIARLDAAAARPRGACRPGSGRTMSRSTVMRSFSGQRRLLEVELPVVPLEDAVDDLARPGTARPPTGPWARARPSRRAPCPGACPSRWPGSRPRTPRR